jgi:hypothetical protein
MQAGMEGCPLLCSTPEAGQKQFDTPEAGQKQLDTPEAGQKQFEGAIIKVRGDWGQVVAQAVGPTGGLAGVPPTTPPDLGDKTNLTPWEATTLRYPRFPLSWYSGYGWGGNGKTLCRKARGYG